MKRKPVKMAMAVMLLGVSAAAGPAMAADPFGAGKALPRDLTKEVFRPELAKEALARRVDLAVNAVLGPGCVCPEKLERESLIFLARPSSVLVEVRRKREGAPLRARVELTVPLLAGGERSLVPGLRTYTKEVDVPSRAGVVNVSFPIPRLLVARFGRSVSVKVTPLGGFEDAQPADNQRHMPAEDLCLLGVR